MHPHERRVQIDQPLVAQWRFERRQDFEAKLYERRGIVKPRLEGLRRAHMTPEVLDLLRENPSVSNGIGFALKPISGARRRGPQR